MNIIWLGHSAFRMDIDDAKILIDPFLRGNPSFPDEHFDRVTKGVTHIALTHGHSDHLGDTIEIAKTSGAKVLCNYDLGTWLQTKGVENVDLGNTGGTLKHDGFSVTFVDAKHSASVMEDGVSHATGSANGLVFHFDNAPTVYHMGDTDIFSDMALINELHQPKIAMVPIGDRFTMGPAVAALACHRFFDFDTVIPCHFGTFPIIEPNAETFLIAMENQANHVQVPVLGQVIEV